MSGRSYDGGNTENCLEGELARELNVSWVERKGQSQERREGELGALQPLRPAGMGDRSLLPKESGLFLPQRRWEARTDTKQEISA